MGKGERHFSGLLMESTAVVQNPLGSFSFCRKEQSYKEAGVYMKLADMGVSRSFTDLLPV